MKPILFGLLMLMSVCNKTEKTNPVQSTLEQIVEHAETASLYRNNVDWDTLRPIIYKLAENAKSISELSPALNYMMAALGDEHGRIFHNNQLIGSYYSGEIKEHQKTFKPEIYNTIQMSVEYPFIGQLLDNNIGYIRIIGLPTGDNTAMSKDIQDKVCELLDQGAEKWIVDLRYNGGGNMFPMVEGLAVLIGDGNVGGTQGVTESESSEWRVENSDFYYDDYSVGLEETCELKKLPKVAVLTSVYTASSGEALAVIFKGRENTRFFGGKTVGLITATDWTSISDSTGMTISVSYYKDRNGRVYNEYVDVDEELPFSEEPLSKNDKCLEGAKDWLNRNGD